MNEEKMLQLECLLKELANECIDNGCDEWFSSTELDGKELQTTISFKLNTVQNL